MNAHEALAVEESILSDLHSLLVKRTHEDVIGISKCNIDRSLSHIGVKRQFRVFYFKFRPKWNTHC